MQTRQTDLARLLMGTKVFVVPQFQRHYKWKPIQWQELWDDIEDQYTSDDVLSGNLSKDEGHFLGSIVLHPAPGPASTVSRYWVIDGQQRLTTLLVILAALRDLRAERDPGWNPNAYTDSYLRNPYNDDDPHRLVLGDNDRSDFVATVYESNPSGQVGQAYRWFLAALTRAIDSDGAPGIEKLEQALLLRMLLVEINTSDDDNINQIFNTINHAGMRLSAIDLIRNHSFMQFDSMTAGEVYETTWKPLENRLGEDRLAQYLWAQLVRDNPKATQRDLYGPFQTHLSNVARRDEVPMGVATLGELTRLLEEVNLFEVATERTSAQASTYGASLIDALLDLQDWGSQTYLPVALDLLSRMERGALLPSDAELGLRMVLSYLVRRGLAGVPTNNLNRILSALPNAIRNDSDAPSAIGRELLSGGKYWPRDREIAERALSTPIYLTLQPKQVKFVLAELNDAKAPSEAVSRESLTVEHIMPQELSVEWMNMLSSNSVPLELAESRTNVIGNLTLTGFNSELARKSPREKTAMYRESNLPLNREFPPTEIWTPAEIDRRSAELARRVVSIWQRPDEERYESVAVSASPSGPDEFDLDLLLGALPADSHATAGDLADLVGLPQTRVAEVARRLGYPVVEAPSGEVLIGGVQGIDDAELLGSRRAAVAELVADAQKIGDSRGADSA